MEMIDVSLLREHPRNSEFFDDIEGERWKEFLESIKTSGIIVPLIVTRDYLIVSGNQRYRAAKKLGLKQVPCEVRDYHDKNGVPAEDLILKDLIETNLRQRGLGNLNPMKMARCILELERIYGIKHGGSRKSENDYQELPGSSWMKSQLDLAKDIGISEARLKQLKKLNDLIPELQRFVEERKLSSKAAEQLAYLDEEVQRQVLSVLGDEISRMSLEQAKAIRREAEENVQNLIEELNRVKEENAQRDIELQTVRQELMKKDDELKHYESKTNETEQKVRELEQSEDIVPDNVRQEIEMLKQELKDMQAEFEKAQKEREQLRETLEKKDESYNSLKAEYETLKHHAEKKYEHNVPDKPDYVDYAYAVSEFLKKVSPYVYYADKFAEMDEEEREKWLEKADYVQIWVDDFKAALRKSKGGGNPAKVIYLERSDKDRKD